MNISKRERYTLYTRNRTKKNRKLKEVAGRICNADASKENLKGGVVALIGENIFDNKSFE